MASFDLSAPVYDLTFSETLTGQAMRQSVWTLLERHVLTTTEKKLILELNGGTGIDAQWLAAKKNYCVICTDASAAMLEIARHRNSNVATLVETHLWDLSIRNLSFLGNRKPDLVFSNFGGLNCLGPDQLNNLSKALAANIAPNALLVAVVMPRYCWMETLYFLLKGRWAEAFRRRKTGPLPVPVHCSLVPTWYYSPPQFYSYFRSDFAQVATYPVGIGLPPSYLDPFFMKHPSIFALARKVEASLGSISFLSAIADHFFIILRKK